MRKNKIGFGFIITIFTYLAVTLFLVWGFSKPELDKVWQISHDLKSGKIKQLNDSDRVVLSNSLKKYPDLLNELNRGNNIAILSNNDEGLINADTVTILRNNSSEDDRIIKIDFEPLNKKSPIEVFIKGNSGKNEQWNWYQSKKVVNNNFIEFMLPNPSKDSEIIELSFNNQIKAKVSFLKSDVKEVKNTTKEFYD